MVTSPRPGAPELDRATWPVVVRPCPLEVGQHVLRAGGRPDREKAVIVVVEAASATHGDEPRIPDLGEDHPPAGAGVTTASRRETATVVAAASAITARPYA